MRRIWKSSRCLRSPKSSRRSKRPPTDKPSTWRAMPVNILMPALSPTMEKGNLAKWLKKEGDQIKTGDVIAEIETDKATMEYEAIEDGTLAKIVVPEGTNDVPVNHLIAVLAQEGEDVNSAAAVAAKAGPVSPGPGASAPSPQPSPQRAESVKPQSAPQPPTKAPAPPPSISVPSGERSAPKAPGEGGRPNGRVFASPLARRLAKEVGIEIGRIQGSGPHGRVIARDIAA